MNRTQVVGLLSIKSPDRTRWIFYGFFMQGRRFIRIDKTALTIYNIMRCKGGWPTEL